MRPAFATLLIGDREWVGPAAAIVTVSVLALVAVYLRTPADRRTCIRAALPKAMGLLLLAACLIDPLWSSTRAKPGENVFILLADNSASLTVRSDGGRTRGEQLKNVLINTESPWQVRLAQDFDVRRYQFDARLSHVEGFDGVDFTGTASSIDAVLASLAERYRDQPLAGVLLFTDGNATGATGAARRTQRVPTLPPVYPVLPPRTTVPPDLSVIRVAASETVFEDAPITVKAEIEAGGEFPQGVVVELLDGAGEVLETRSAAISEAEPLAIRFQTRPHEPGVQFYTVRVKDASQTNFLFDDPESSREATLVNNSRSVAVNREGRPYRVLYVGGRPNWEYRTLNRALKQDEQVQLVTLIRIARKEAKFDFRGRADESSNPLFRGFKKEGDEETESYDEPVLTRLGVEDESELAGGFPREKADLYRYDAIILDDVEAEFFRHDQLALIERFVSERGGGLMMLGGVDTFRNGGYERTPVADALPVYLDRPATGSPGEEYRWALTRDGWLQPWMRLRSNEPDEEARLSEMPAFLSVNRIDSVKPGGRVMAVLESPRSEPLPAVVTQRYGGGRSLAVLVGDLWRWSLKRPAGAEDDLGKMWRQFVRWLVSDNPQRLEVDLSRRDEGTDPMIDVAVRVRDREFQPQENADLDVTVRLPDGESMTVDLWPSMEEIGLFTGSFVSRQPGGYRADVTQENADGPPPLRTSVGWTSNPAADEFRDIGIGHEAMQELAEETGGEVVSIEELEEFVRELPLRPAPVTETWTSPLWHRWWVLLLVLACLAGEWGFRRLRGLP